MRNTGRLEILIGISATGKSKYAKEQWEAAPKKVVVVSRDAMRQLLFGYTDANLNEYYYRNDLVGREKQVTEMVTETIRYQLGKGMRVIVDNTHLKLGYIEKYQDFGVKTDLTIFNTDLDTSIRRDNARVKQVGEVVLKRQQKQFNTVYKELNIKMDLNVDIIKIIDYKFKLPAFKYVPNMILPTCIIVDIDGTVAEKGKRCPYDMTTVGNDTVVSNVVGIVNAMADRGIYVVFCTGREDTGKVDTLQWLGRHAINHDEVHFRKEGDYRPDYLVKEEMWMEIIKKYQVMTMIDDRRQVIDHARKLGFTVMDVANNTF